MSEIKSKRYNLSRKQIEQAFEMVNGWLVQPTEVIEGLKEELKDVEEQERENNKRG